MDHRRGRGIDAGIDHQRVGLRIYHETVGCHVVPGRSPRHDTEALALEAQIAQRVNAVKAMPLFEHQSISRAVIWIGDLHQVIALRHAHDNVAFVGRERIAHEAGCLRIPAV